MADWTNKGPPMNERLNEWIKERNQPMNEWIKGHTINERIKENTTNEWTNEYSQQI